ncbi:hypothetical protein KDU71_16355 [Carboxylicivirga sediminis]|uniref:Outer membrane protein beta-barrel domain-containing protein n=1 Tax=Carboxylicivirga sediminis TaxID=2006564 RepID=A0A941F7B5_9BACT|nr:hypothetical protein [Carboxylicivirga sediminis]MBR8537143.1 hypothetical protein [Carboxylicivirga sediminis]
MKKLILIALLFGTAWVANAQVFGSPQMVGKGKGNFGMMPTLLVTNGNDQLMLFMNGGFGIAQGIDLGMKLGVLGNSNFVGMDLQFSKSKNFSFAAGIHSFNDVALDLTGLLSFNVGKGARLSTGLDADIVFANTTRMPVWIPINLEIWIKENMTFMLEADIDTKLFSNSYHLISVGVQVYF